MLRRFAVVVAVLGVTAALALVPTRGEADHIREGDVRFKTTCNWEHSAPDDPIIYPNQPGASHLHDFFGAVGVDAYTTTYNDLTGQGTTCNDPGDEAGYWTPALETTDGFATPTRMTVYYRRGNKHGTIATFPSGLRMVAGWSHETGPTGLQVTGWQCHNSPAKYPTPPLDCGTGHLSMYVKFPDCWDGEHRAPPGARSHMAYSVHEGDANVCPAGFPVPIPSITTTTNWPSVPNGQNVIGLASGSVLTVHGDFFDGWEPARLQERIDTCLNGLQRCGSGG